MRTVTIKNGIYKGEEVNGTFPCRYRAFKSASNGKDSRIEISMDGEPRLVRVNASDCVYHDDDKAVDEVIATVEETEEEIAERIKKRFSVMNKMATGAIKGVVKSLIISGAPGVGKTFTLEKKLDRAAIEGDIKYDSVKGKCSAIGLYIKLWENREANSVLLLDDVDVFSNEDSLNLLKAAVDSGEVRNVSWQTASSYLEEKEIPNSFEFEGTVIFISNMDFDREIERDSKIAPHVDALLSRSIYLDLGVHTKREIMVRVKDVVKNTNMLTSKGLNSAQIAEMMVWVEENVDMLRNLSLRTMLHLGDMVLTDSDWKEMAEVTLLKPVRRRR